MRFNVLISFAGSFRIPFHTEFISVYTYHYKKQGYKYWSEDYSNKSKHINPYNNSENSDQGMYITKLFCEPESENIIHTANNAATKSQYNKAPYRVATGK